MSSMPGPRLLSLSGVLRCSAILVTVACARSDTTPISSAPGVTTAREIRGDTTVVRSTGMNEHDSFMTLVEEIQISYSDSIAGAVLGVIHRVSAMPGGGVVLTEGSTVAPRQVKLFDEAGRFLRDVGRRGGGPGEYMTPDGIAVAPTGRILIWHRMGVSIYSANGEYEQLWSSSPAPGQFVDDSGRVYSEATVDDPTFSDSILPHTGRRLQRPVAIRTTLDGRVIDTIISPGSTPMRRASIALSDGAFSTSVALPYVPRFFSALSPRGYYVAGDAVSYEIALRDSVGDPMRILSDRRAVSVDPDERRSHLERIRRRTREIRDSDIPEVKPYFKNLQVDDDGRIWVWLHRPSELTPILDSRADSGAAADVTARLWTEPTVYDVFAPTGEFRSSVRLPDGATFAAARGDKLWLVIRDSMDVQKLVRYNMK